MTTIVKYEIHTNEKWTPEQYSKLSDMIRKFVEEENLSYKFHRGELVNG